MKIILSYKIVNKIRNQKMRIQKTTKKEDKLQVLFQSGMFFFSLMKRMHRMINTNHKSLLCFS